MTERGEVSLREFNLLNSWQSIFIDSAEASISVIARGVASWQSILSFDFMESLETFRNFVCDSALSALSLRLDSAGLFFFMDCFTFWRMFAMTEKEESSLRGNPQGFSWQSKKNNLTP